MEAVKKAKHRMNQLPGLVMNCKAQASVYAKCVISSDDIKRNDCQQEFNKFLDCVRSNAVAKKTRFI